jgi:hypothetical protein
MWVQSNLFYAGKQYMPGETYFAQATFIAPGQILRYEKAALRFISLKPHYSRMIQLIFHR